MIATAKEYTVDGLIMDLYEDNYSHFDFIFNMNGGDCDCMLHSTMNILKSYSDQHHTATA